MDHVVAKEFKTVNRVMRVGTAVRPDDYLEPHSFDIMKARGFIEEVAPAPAHLETPPRGEDDLARPRTEATQETKRPTDK